MKNTIIIICSITLFLGYGVFGQSNFSVIDSTKADEIYLTYSFNEYELKQISLPNGVSSKVVAKDMTEHLIKGMPDVPKFTESFIIPQEGEMNVEVLSSTYVDLQNINIIPSKGNPSRNINPEQISYEYDRIYEENAFFPRIITQLNEPYILRDYRGQALHVFPFQYNPITKVLRVYSSISLRLYKEKQVGGVNLFKGGSDKKIVSEFDHIYKRHFKNYENNFVNRTANTPPAPLIEEGKMLIICHDSWMGTMEPFVLWKNTIGRPCEIISVTAAGGTAENIKNYVTNYYNNNGLTYLLLVGDAAQVPVIKIPDPFGGSVDVDSDNAYAYINGNDHYQEFFVGRLSAETVAHVTTQIERTIVYEKGNTLSEGWLNKVMSIGSDQGPGDDNELDFEHLRNIQTDLIGFTYDTSPVYEFFDGSQGGFDGAQSPTPSHVSSALNLGAGIINYTGHGGSGGWGTSGFSNTNITNLNNVNKLPFITSVACQNGNFVNETCFAETWLRSVSSNGNPIGAIAINASTINQTWSPPMVAQDEFVDLITANSIVGFRRTFGGIIANGYFKMNDETSDFSMTDTWTCFGDPSLMIRTDNPSSMIVSHESSVLLNASSFSINCNFEGAFATISINGQIIGSAYVVGGIAVISIATLLNPLEPLTIAVVGFNKTTYLNTIPIVPVQDSYLVVNSFENTIDFGQTKSINATFKNVGLNNSINGSVIASVTDSNVTFINTTVGLGNLNSGSIYSTTSNDFIVSVANDLPDQYEFPIDFQMMDNSGNVWNQTKKIYVNAPQFEVLGLVIDDSSGNNNGIIDPGETATIEISVKNVGHASVTNTIGNIQTLSNDITITSGTTLPILMNSGATESFVFYVASLSTALDGTIVPISFNINAGIAGQYTKQKDFEITIGITYCDAISNISTDEYIEQVIFNTINNTSIPAGGYTNFTNISTEVIKGQSYPISIKNGQHWDGDQMGCWVDWNHNGSFDEQNEAFDILYDNNTHIGTGSITVPNSDLVNGNVRMRIRVLYNDVLAPCGITGYGETEDYTLTVVNSPLNNVSFFENNDIEIYPNPSKGLFTIHFANDLTYDSNLEIFNINGQLIYKNKSTNNIYNVALNVEDGMYFAKITSGNDVYLKKVIIMK